MDKDLNINYVKRSQKDYSMSFKLQVDQEVELGELSASAASRKYGIQGGQTDKKVINGLGKLLNSTDNMGVSVTYEYDVEDNCTKIKGPRTTIETEYDILGNRTKLIDPDLGTIEYEYNAYGELVSRKHEYITTYVYDNGGRLVSESTNDGYTGDITYVYDTRWKGALSERVAANSYYPIVEQFYYDKYGRAIATVESHGDKTFVTETAYDAFSRVKMIAYPSGFVVQNEYNENGYLSKVKDYVNNTVYWTANMVNARGQLEQFTLGNGLVTNKTYSAKRGHIENIRTGSVQDWTYDFDSVGNLSYKKDNRRNKTESFRYDALNRLSEVYHNGALTQEIEYDAAGNITYKTGVGNDFKYKAGTNKLESVSGAGYSPRDWDYIFYNSSNKICFIVQDYTNSLQYIYGADKQRKVTEIYYTVAWERKHYIGALYEEEYVGIGSAERAPKKIHYIFANGEAVAIYEQSGNYNEKVLYLHKDYLGSVQAYTDQAGRLVQELSYVHGDAGAILIHGNMR